MDYNYLRYALLKAIKGSDYADRIRNLGDSSDEDDGKMDDE